MTHLMAPPKNNLMNPKKSLEISRRDFFRQSCCAAVGSVGILSTLAQLRVLGGVIGSSSGPVVSSATIPADYKALVCIYLIGGNDGTNTIIPADASSYAAYAKARADISIPQGSLLAIKPSRYSDGRAYGLHPSVPELQALFNQRKLAFLANVGTLVQPTNLAQYNLGQGLPPQLFSHQDQSTQWQSSIPDKPFTTGWGGRLADLVDASNANNQISMSISLSGTNSFQRGNKVAEFALRSSGVQQIQTNFVDPVTGQSIVSQVAASARATAVRAMMNTAQANLHSAAFADISAKAISDTDFLTTVFKTAPAINTSFPGTPTAKSMAMIAKMISVAPSLGLKRQIFFLTFNGWDTHGGQAVAHGPLLAELSGAMNAFYNATVELGVANQVTTFTASDFGRTYTPNSGGTDHGWGGHQMIMGGAVSGGDIYGTMPSLVVNGPDDTGRGRWIPSTSVDEYNATLATWFGVSATDLPIVLPNIGRFAKPNLGFMG